MHKDLLLINASFINQIHQLFLRSCKHLIKFTNTDFLSVKKNAISSFLVVIIVNLLAIAILILLDQQNTMIITVHFDVKNDVKMGINAQETAGNAHTMKNVLYVESKFITNSLVVMKMTSNAIYSHLEKRNAVQHAIKSLIDVDIRASFNVDTKASVIVKFNLKKNAKIAEEPSITCVVKRIQNA